MRIIEETADATSLARADELARAGQIVRVAIEAGVASLTLRAKGRNAQELTLQAAPIDSKTWDKAINALSREALFAAAIQVGRIPTSVDDAFAPLGVRLFPARAEEIAVEGRGVQAWNPTACWVMRVLADRLAREPLQLLTWRGMEGEQVVERVRQRRAAIAGRAAGAQPAYLQSPPPAAVGLDADLPVDPATFWSAGADLDALNLTMHKPEVAHALLRRLGASPFEDAKFPILGLLATCYSCFEASKDDDAPSDGGAGASNVMGGPDEPASGR